MLCLFFFVSYKFMLPKYWIVTEVNSETEDILEHKIEEVQMHKKVKVSSQNRKKKISIEKWRLDELVLTCNRIRRLKWHL